MPVVPAFGDRGKEEFKIILDYTAKSDWIHETPSQNKQLKILLVRIAVPGTSVEEEMNCT